jgi:hypothetical protein
MGSRLYILKRRRFEVLSVIIRYAVIFLALFMLFVLEMRRRNRTLRIAVLLGLDRTWFPLGLGLFILYLVIVLILALTT